MYKILKVIGKLLKFVEVIIGNIENFFYIIIWININIYIYIRIYLLLINIYII